MTVGAASGVGILLQVAVGGTPTTIGGLRTKSLTINGDAVDVTTSDSAGRWQELLANAAVKSIEATGAGVVQNDALGKSLVAAIIAGTKETLTLVIPGIGTFAGDFFFTNAKYNGEHTNAVMFDLTMKSTGQPTFTPAS